jgi:hypothetical protein
MSLPKKSDPLVGPKLKIERAKNHIRDLHQAVRAFIESKPYVLFEQHHPHSTTKDIKVRQRLKLPPEIGLIAADAVHNLRVSLDRLVGRLAESNGAPDLAGVSFPFAGDAQTFQSRQCRGKISKLSTDAQRSICALKPYLGGNNLLWSLNELDIIDKHRDVVAIGSTNAGIRATIGGETLVNDGPIGTLIKDHIQLITGAAWCHSKKAQS